MYICTNGCTYFIDLCTYEHNNICICMYVSTYVVHTYVHVYTYEVMSVRIRIHTYVRTYRM